MSVICWNEPLWGKQDKNGVPKFLGNTVIRATETTVIAYWREFHPSHVDDEEALNDFMVIHWAWRENPEIVAKYSLGQRVEKYTGDYQLSGEIVSVFTTKTGKVRYVVEHEPGFLHIYSESNLRAVKD